MRKEYTIKDMELGFLRTEYTNGEKPHLRDFEEIIEEKEVK